MNELTLDPNLLSIALRKVGRPIEELRQEHGLPRMAGPLSNENPLGPSQEQALREVPRA